MEDDDTNSIISKDDFNWLCQKENYVSVPIYPNDRESNCSEKTNLTEVSNESMENIIINRES